MKAFADFPVEQRSSKNNEQPQSQLRPFVAKSQLRRNPNMAIRQIVKGAAAQTKMKQSPCFRRPAQKH